MNRILTTLLFTATITAQVFGQCTATSQTVSTTTTSSICLDGSTSYTVTLDGSEVGLEYVLIDTLDGSVIEGPLAGTGNPIDFNTGNLTRTTTFEVLAQTPPTAGNALRFGGGQNDFASVRDAWNFDYSQGYTMEFVFNGNTDPSNFFNSLFSIGGDFINGNARVDDLEVYFQQATTTLVVVHGRGQSSLQYGQYASPTSFTDVHIAIVFDPTLQNDQDKLKVYYDGVRQQQVNTDSQITTMIKSQQANFYVGDIKHQDFASITDVCNGTFDELRIWNHGRTEAQINANKTTCVSASEQGLAHYYRFDEGSGSVLSDETGNGRDLDIISTSGNVFWVPELVACQSDCQIPMANTVTIGDLDAPTLSLSSTVSVLDLGATGNAIVNLADLVTAAADNCSDSSALVFTSDITSFTCNDLGVNPIFVTVADESGNEATSGTVVNVRELLL